MSMSNNVFKNFATSVLEKLGLAVWVEVATESPRCTYYFGPFLSTQEAEAAKLGYLEDLEAEGATGIAAIVKRCNPEKLTVYDETLDFRLNRTPSLSGHSF
ncbi:DUF1816 domain-containing protein [Tumidithrix elongata]